MSEFRTRLELSLDAQHADMTAHLQLREADTEKRRRLKEFREGLEDTSSDSYQAWAKLFGDMQMLNQDTVAFLRSKHKPNTDIRVPRSHINPNILLATRRVSGWLIIKSIETSSDGEGWQYTSVSSTEGSALATDGQIYEFSDSAALCRRRGYFAQGSIEDLVSSPDLRVKGYFTALKRFGGQRFVENMPQIPDHESMLSGYGDTLEAFAVQTTAFD